MTTTATPQKLRKLKLWLEAGDAIHIADGGTGVLAEVVLDTPGRDAARFTAREVWPNERPLFDGLLALGQSLALVSLPCVVDIEIDDLRNKRARVFLRAVRDTAIIRVPLDARIALAKRGVCACDSLLAPGTESDPPKPANALAIDPGDECVITWSDGTSELATVLAFRSDGRVNIRMHDNETPEQITVPMSYLTRIPH